MKRSSHSPFAGQHPRSLPRYSTGEAARCVRMAQGTLRTWVVGRSYQTQDGEAFFKPLIGLPDPERLLLSFENLVEAHVLRALRTEHDVSLRAVRKALEYAQGELGIERLLLSPELKTKGGDLFLDTYGQLLNLSKSGQIAMRHVLEAYLKRIEWEREFPIRLFPFTVPGLDSSRTIAIDPLISFGKPIVFRRSISTSVIAQRIDAGEAVDELAADYGLNEEEINEAVLYERAAA